MLRFANETGGHAFVKTNGVAGSVVKAINMGANHYTLTYVPSNTKWDGKTRKIHVNLDGKNYRLILLHCQRARSNSRQAIGDPRIHDRRLQQREQHGEQDQPRRSFAPQ
jgi:hypothetical protein